MTGLFAIAVDIGGTKTAIAAVDGTTGAVGRRLVLPTPARAEAGPAFQDRLAGRALDLAQETGARAVGVSICELVDHEGQVTSANRVQWRNGRLEQALAPLAVTVEADIRAAALAEARLGAGRGAAEFLYVNLGTGVSACWVRDGVPHRGVRGNALVLASSAVRTRCAACGAEHVVVPEEVAGAAGLVAGFRAAGGRAADARHVFAAAEQGDARARAVLSRAVEALAVPIGAAVNLLDPERLIFGGGLAAAGGAYGEPLEKAVRAQIWAPDTRALPIRRAELGADSALVGAALAVAGV